MKAICVVLVLACVCHGLNIDPEFKTQQVALQLEKHASDDDLIGGDGVEEQSYEPEEKLAPQTSSLLEENEGSDDGDDVTMVVPPEAEDAATEIQQSQGAAAVMSNPGLGHMVGSNEAVVTKVEPLSDTLKEKQSKVAALKAEIQSLNAETTRKQQALQARKDSQKSTLSEIDSSYKRQLERSQQEHANYIASVKREAALKLKHIRNDNEQFVQTSHQHKMDDIAHFKDSIQSQIQEMNTKIDALRSREDKANNEAEKIYAANRVAWKRKHEMEVQDKGVKAEIDKETEELKLIKLQLESKEQTVKDLKQHIKEQARDKLLMAARLKNLHNHEEGLKQVEQKFKTENERLHHQLDELKLTSSENSQLIQTSKQEAENAVNEASKLAEAQGKKEVTNFEHMTLSKMQDEITHLKQEVVKQSKHESHEEVELLQQEHNVQAEKKEAEDALAKAKYDLDIANEQIKIEHQQAHLKSISIVDEARRQAAQIRETARVSGFHDGDMQIQDMIQEQATKENELKLKESEIAKMKHEFSEKTDQQITAHEEQVKLKFEQDSQQMKVTLQHEIEEKLEQERAIKETEFKKIKADFIAEQSRAEKEEQDIDTANVHNQQLMKEIENLRQESQHQKEELTSQTLAALN